MKILFFITKYLCYESNTAFIDEMIKAFHKRGIATEICEVLDENSAVEILQKLKGKKYDACIDFNAVTPLAVYDNGVRFLDTLQAPFFNYIVDNPFYHHAILKIPLKNYHVLCLDRDHVTYIKKYYPHIKSAHFLPLGAMKAMSSIPYCDKKIDLLFTGTYYMEDKVYLEQIEEYSMEEKNDINSIIDLMLADETLTMEDSLLHILQDRQQVLETADFAALMNRYHKAEFYIRAHNRNRLVNTVLKAGIPLTIIGDQWDCYKTPYEKYLTVKKPVSFQIAIEKILHAKMALNVLPNFKNGIHDRILTAMNNGSIAITDESKFLKEHFTDEEDILYYTFAEIDRLPEKIMKYSSDLVLSEKIAQSGRAKVEKDFQWEKRVDEFLNIIANLK